MAQQVTESVSSRCERATKDGRRLWYDLRVIQQPERARACGSGPKSSTDRRPIDPPPVVEFHIYEGKDWESRKDITFHYNANFFLFATLDHARVIAHGRVQAPAGNAPPVLSGMPVSGMAYLDRPAEAGYFLFPDLSVRHEGRYRLTFSLYEQTKDEDDKNAAVEDLLEDIDAPSGSFDFRMSIASNDFSVFSAKRFPGLAESTGLSRTIAEQGCRVRIRRDVRMRRRDGKPGGDRDNMEEEYHRRHITPTPDPHRHRSVSVHSVERTPLSADSQRRMSGAEYPPSQASQSPARPYLHFGNQSSSQYYAPPAPPHSSHSSSVPPSPSYQNGAYPPGSSYPPPPPPPQPYGYPERPPSRPYSAGSRERQHSDAEYRPQPDVSLPRLSQQYDDEEISTRTVLAPIQTTGLSQRSPSSGLPSATLLHPPVNNPSRDDRQSSEPRDFVDPALAVFGIPATARRAKRSRTGSVSGQLKNGARPNPRENLSLDFLLFPRSDGGNVCSLPNPALVESRM